MPLYTLLTLAVLPGRIPAPHPAASAFTWASFFGQFATSASYNISYAPSVSDYSRYLPRSTRPPAITAANSLLELRPGARLRLLTIIGLATVWLGLAFTISADAIALLFAVLTIMLYLLVPWTAVDLVDCFFVRRGRCRRRRRSAAAYPALSRSFEHVHEAQAIIGSEQSLESLPGAP